jgi:hypothetical protein
MSLNRAVMSAASIFLGLSAALAQQPQTAPAAFASNALTNPPVFQGLMMDAKGKTVGRLFPSFPYIPIGGAAELPSNLVVRQISRVWVALQVDVLQGFTVSVDLDFLYTSVDCAGQAYLAVSSNFNPTAVLPARGYVWTIPPATQPSVYFAGPPYSNLVINSDRDAAGGCSSPSFGAPVFVGPAQSVPVSSLGLTLPFSVE